MLKNKFIGEVSPPLLYIKNKKTTTSVILEDSYGRKFDYLRISLTDRCNLNCFYCLPAKKMQRDEILSLEEIEKLIHIFHTYFEINKVRLTGGEPLLRKGIDDLIKWISLKYPNIQLNITTNGILLSEKVNLLKECNVSVNVSLDTLNPDKFRNLTGFNLLEKIINGIDLAIELELRLKLNTVALKGINDDEIFSLIEFALNRNIEIRFIELMTFSSNGFWKKHFMSENEIKSKIEQRYKLRLIEKDKIATRYILDNGAKVGLISPITNPFCALCSRLRITSTGKMVLCMFDNIGYPLMEFLRPEFRAKELVEYISTKVKLKPRGYIDLKSEKPELSIRELGG